MKSKEFVRWQDQEALRRFQLISTLITADADSAKRIAERKRLAETHDISERTLRRYEEAFRKSGFEGLKPAGRAEAEVKGPFPGFKKALDEAILLKREVPSRSVNQIIFILEAEHVVNPCQLTRPTLQRYLYTAGFGKKQMKKVTEGENLLPSVSVIIPGRKTRLSLSKRAGLPSFESVFPPVRSASRIFFS